MEADASDIEFTDGQYRVVGTDKAVTIMDVAKAAYAPMGPLTEKFGVGLEALESALSRDPATGLFCHGAAPTLADICLVPQLANARRVDMDLTPYPTLVRIDATCRQLPAFSDAAPQRQFDFEP